MNIIVIISDTLRRDYLGAYGNSWVQTPNLDGLAREATVFDRAYIGSFPTMPMRFDFMTGHYAFPELGWGPIPPGEVVCQALLQEAGYVTMLIADHAQMLSPGYNYHQGFHGYEWIRGQAGEPWATAPFPVELPCGPDKARNPAAVLRHMRNVYRRVHEEDYFVAQTMRAGMTWLEDNRTHEKFYLYLDTFDVHEPWDPPQWYVDMYDPGYEGDIITYPRYDRCDYLSHAELKHCRALYAGEITMMDHWVGQVIDKVKRLGLWDNTAILFTSDHGYYHGEHAYIGKHTVLDREMGWPLYEEVCHVPLILRIPGLGEGTRCDALVQPVDTMAALLELGRADAPGDLHGKSYLPVLRGEAESIRDLAVCSHRLRPDPGFRIYSTITDGEWSLHYAGDKAPAELYHLPTDPGEQNDLAADHPDIAQRLHAAHVETLEGIGTPEDTLALRRARASRGDRPVAPASPA